jgi:stage V sporulation protein K
VTESPQRSTDEIMKDLMSFVGQAKLKEQLPRLISRKKAGQVWASYGIKQEPEHLGFVFLGPPGTGKTTIARLLGELLAAYGYLKSGRFVETSRAGLVAGYVGQTALKTTEVFENALGGILFIDEAYSLSSSKGSSNDFGKEAIDTLVKLIDDHRGEIAVIVAGYRDEMDDFLTSNPGMKSRFLRFVDFEAYDLYDLAQIFAEMVSRAGFKMDCEDLELISAFLSLMERLKERDGSSFGNARTVRNLFDHMKDALALDIDKQNAEERTKEFSTTFQRAHVEDGCRAMLDSEDPITFINNARRWYERLSHTRKRLEAQRQGKPFGDDGPTLFGSPDEMKLESVASQGSLQFNPFDPLVNRLLSLRPTRYDLGFGLRPLPRLRRPTRFGLGLRPDKQHK